jgi:hypothetical protein
VAISKINFNSRELVTTPAFLATPATGQNNIALNTAVTVVLGTEGRKSGANIITSNRNYLFTIDNAADFSADFSENPFCCTLSVLADMDAGDTAHLTVQCQGGTQQTDIYTGSFFGGYLVA